MSAVSAPFGTVKRHPEPLGEEAYASILAVWLLAEDVHDVYRGGNLARWHVPVPWRSRLDFHNGRLALVLSELEALARERM